MRVLLLALALIVAAAPTRPAVARIAQLAKLPKASRERIIRALPAADAERLLTQWGTYLDGLMAFIPKVSPQYSRPDHLAPLVDVLTAAARGEAVRAVISTPPQHGKTETLLHGLAWLLAVDPARTVGYISYGDSVAHSKSIRARAYAEHAGIALATDAAREWRTREGGGVLATGVGGPLTGHGLNGLLVDDPFKNRAEAESALVRQRTWDWFTDVAYTRLAPDAWVIVNAARWHPDDLSGRLIADGWRQLNLKAIGDDGAALWPERYSLERLNDIRGLLGEYSWVSLYQGEPRARGGAVFGDAHLYDEAPAAGYRLGAGIDLAYSAKTSSDWSVGLLLAEAGGLHYVLDVVRKQVRAPEFKAALHARWSDRTGLRPRWYASGTEIGSADFLRQEPDGINVDARPAVGDKFLRAQPVAAAWNAGKILVPKSAPWADAFVSELAAFTGVKDAHDDQVDTLAAAFDALTEPEVGWSLA